MAPGREDAAAFLHRPVGESPLPEPSPASAAGGQRPTGIHEEPLFRTSAEGDGYHCHFGLVRVDGTALPFDVAVDLGFGPRPTALEVAAGDGV